MKETKRFSDWNECEVDCNECELYWLNQCDGVHKAQKRLCTSFKATRSVVIPQQIKSLQKGLKWLSWALVGVSVFQLIALIIILIYYF